MLLLLECPSFVFYYLLSGCLNFWVFCLAAATFFSDVLISHSDRDDGWMYIHCFKGQISPTKRINSVVFQLFNVCRTITVSYMIPSGMWSLVVDDKFNATLSSLLSSRMKDGVKKRNVITNQINKFKLIKLHYLDVNT